MPRQPCADGKLEALNPKSETNSKLEITNSKTEEEADKLEAVGAKLEIRISKSGMPNDEGNRHPDESMSTTQMNRDKH